MPASLMRREPAPRETQNRPDLRIECSVGAQSSALHPAASAHRPAAIAVSPPAPNTPCAPPHLGVDVPRNLDAPLASEPGEVVGAAVQHLDQARILQQRPQRPHDAKRAVWLRQVQQEHLLLPSSCACGGEVCVCGSGGVCVEGGCCGCGGGQVWSVELGGAGEGPGAEGGAGEGVRGGGEGRAAGVASLHGLRCPWVQAQHKASCWRCWKGWAGLLSCAAQRKRHKSGGGGPPATATCSSCMRAPTGRLPRSTTLSVSRASSWAA
jgi:hypothetical protein